MARARNIKPALFKNEVLGVADPMLTLLFEGLWLLADRSGRLEDRPLRIKGELFPYREGLNMDGMLDWLASNGFIIRYQADGKCYIEIDNFVKHQNPHKNEPDSEIPAPSDTCTTSDKIGTSPEKLGSAPADSLIPDSLIPDSLQKPSACASAPAAGKSDRLEGFAQFWLIYPRKTAKQNAEKAWAKLRPDRSLQAQLLVALGRQAKSADWTKDGGAFIPHAATWLNGRRWEDEVQGPLLDKHKGFNGERDYKQGLEGNADGTFKF